MTRLLVAISLVVALVAGGLAIASPVGRGADAEDASATITGTDACGLLPDEDLLRVTDAVGVPSRQPGPLPGMDAGCTWELGATDGEFADWTIFMSVLSPGGRAYFDLFASEGGEELAGIGDAALDDGQGVVAVKGDTFVMLSVIGPGGDAPEDGDVARQLAWRLVSRLDAAPAPSATPTPSEPPRSAVRDLVIRLRAPEFSDDAVDAAVELLARSGIGTYSESTAREPIMAIIEPASPVRLLSDQVRAMALEAWAGGGLPGELIDELVPAEPELPSGSEVLAAYVASASTEGAEAARALMGEIDPASPAEHPFPQLVAILFLSDLVRGAATAGVAGGWPRMALMAGAVGAGPRTAATAGTCADVTDFTHDVFRAVLEALAQERDPIGPVDSIAVEIWGTVHLFAANSGRRIVLEVGRPELELFARVAATVGLSSLLVSFIRPWTLAVTAEPPVTAKGIGGPGEPGAFVLRVDTGGADEWPAGIRACATEAGFQLPDLRPAGAPVTWSAVVQSPDELVAQGTGSTRLDANGTARLDFMTLSDDVEAPWEDRIGRIRVSVSVERPGLEALARIASVGIATPSTGERELRAQLESTIERVRDRLLELVASGAAGAGVVIYHVPQPTPSGSPEPTATPPPRAVMVKLERERIGAAEAGTVLELYSCTGPYGRWSGVIRFGGIDAGEGLGVPWADLAVDFRIQGSGGIRRGFTTVSGVIPSNTPPDVPPITYDIDAFLDFTVDGRTMEVDSRVNIAEQVEGMDLMGGSDRNAPVSLPIVPAPAGACP